MLANIFRQFAKVAPRRISYARAMRYPTMVRWMAGDPAGVNYAVPNFNTLKDYVASGRKFNIKNIPQAIRANTIWHLGGKRALENIGKRLDATSKTARFESFIFISKNMKSNTTAYKMMMVHEDVHRAIYDLRQVSVFGIKPEHGQQLKFFNKALAESNIYKHVALSDVSLKEIIKYAGEGTLRFNTRDAGPVGSFLHELLAYGHQHKYLASRVEGIAHQDALGHAAFTGMFDELLTSVAENTPIVTSRTKVRLAAQARIAMDLKEASKLKVLSESNFITPGVGARPNNPRPSRRTPKGGT